MLQAMEKMIDRYGSTMVLVQNGEEKQIRAFLQVTRSKSQENARQDFSALGERYKGMYVYIGPAQPLAAEGDELHYNGRIFRLQRAESVTVADQTAYCWGLCVERGEESTWGS